MIRVVVPINKVLYIITTTVPAPDYSQALNGGSRHNTFPPPIYEWSGGQWLCWEWWGNVRTLSGELGRLSLELTTEWVGAGTDGDWSLEAGMFGPCDIDVKAIVVGRFEFSEDNEPVSVVYAVSVSRRVNKPAIIEIQHSITIRNEQQSQFLSFVRAECKQPNLLYQFKLLKDGVFFPGNLYEWFLITISHFME